MTSKLCCLICETGTGEPSLKHCPNNESQSTRHTLHSAWLSPRPRHGVTVLTHNTRSTKQKQHSQTHRLQSTQFPWPFTIALKRIFKQKRRPVQLCPRVRVTGGLWIVNTGFNFLSLVVRSSNKGIYSFFEKPGIDFSPAMKILDFIFLQDKAISSIQKVIKHLSSILWITWYCFYISTCCLTLHFYVVQLLSIF